jgi:hypothetical protein
MAENGHDIRQMTPSSSKPTFFGEFATEGA